MAGFLLCLLLVVALRPRKKRKELTNGVLIRTAKEADRSARFWEELSRLGA